MILNNLINKFEDISIDTYDLIDWMKEWECPDLVIEEKQIPQELKTVDSFEKKDISPLTGGENSRLHKNVVEYYIYDSEDEGELLPLTSHKFVTYEREDFAPGMVKITLIFGKKVRKENDYRFTDKIDVQKDSSYFLFDYQTKQYKQVNPKKNEWIDEMTKREEIRQTAIKFIYYYRDLKAAIWIKKYNSFDKSHFSYQFSQEVEALTNKEFLNTMNFFLNMSDDYLYILKFFGSITKDEYHFLIKAIDKQKDRNNKCYEYIVLEEDGLLEEFKSVLNLPNSNPFHDTKYRMEKLLTPRDERLEIITAANYYNGYVYIDTVNNKIYVNLGELDRRINLFHMAGNAESEKAILSEILKVAKQTERNKNSN